MATNAPPTEQRIVLHDISWETYERLLADHVDSSAPRFTYDHGELEILGPSTAHEVANRTLALFVELVAAELSIEVSNVGSMTFKRKDLLRGFEPDSSFYIQNEPIVRESAQIDLAHDPPPDVIVEIEITRSAIAKFPIYAELGVPEVWRLDGERVSTLVLEDGEYREAQTSAALPLLSNEVLTRFMSESRALRRTAWIRQVREWVRDAMPS
jgi:Uma2 family endonuclease